MFLRTLVLAAIGVLLAGPILAKERTWTHADGRQMKAEFVREIDGEVTFLKDGKLITFPLDKLSEKDQQIIRDLTQGKPVPDEEPEGATAPAPSAPGTSSAAGSDDKKPATPKITIESRTWTDDRGNKTTAKFVRINGNDVVLNRSGRTLTISYFSLSEEDQQFVRDVLTQQGKEELIPADRPVASSNNAGAQGVGGAMTASTTGPPTIPGSPFPSPAQGGPGGRGGPPIGPRSGIGGAGIPTPRPGGGFPGAGEGFGPGGGIPGSGIPGSGIPGGGIPGAGGPGGLGPGGGMPLPPTGDIGIPGGSSFGPTGIPGAAGAPYPTSPGAGSGMMPPRTGMNSGFGSGMGSSTFPTAPQVPEIPTIGTIPGSSFSTGPTFEQVYQCSGCKRHISQAESTLDKCPYCGTYWVYKDDGSGRKQFNGVGSRVVSYAAGVFVVIVVVVLGAVGGFIGIVVAIVRAATRPAPRTYQRW